MSSNTPSVHRDISWLSFNYRVLQEAKNTETPLLERIKFLAIYSSNLDEFFRVRIAALRNLFDVKPSIRKKLAFDPHALFDEIRSIVSIQQEEFGTIYRESIIPALQKEDIYILNHTQLNTEQLNFVAEYYKKEVEQHIQTLYLDPEDEPVFLQNNALYLAVSFENTQYAILNIPSDKTNRFIELPSEDDKNYLLFLDDLLRANLEKIFPNNSVTNCYSVKITRDAELYIGDEFSGNLIEKIRNNLTKRQTGIPTRVLIDSDAPQDFCNQLMGLLQIPISELIMGGSYHNFSDFFSFPSFGKSELQYPALQTLKKPIFEKGKSYFDVIKQKDVLLNYVYDNYKYVINFLEEAAKDEDVKRIQISLYRVAKDSKVAQALSKAARNGKEVVVFVEIKARFDEESNLYWAKELEEAGATVLYSMPNLKVHAKILLVQRTEGDKTHLYAYMATGNFNEKTATVYCDHGLFTHDTRLTKELIDVFKFLKSPNYKPKFKHLLVAPFNLRKRLVSLINYEIDQALLGKAASMILKMNSLEDSKMIAKLYEASRAGVKIRLIIRGICCLKPGVKGLSENIKVTSIVDKYLEHARVFCFHHGGDELMYAASADWMKRNLSKRIEVAFPIHDDRVYAEIREILDLQLKDNIKSRIIDAEQKNEFVQNNAPDIRAQDAIYSYLEEKANSYA